MASRRNFVTDACVDVWLGFRTGNDVNDESCLYVCSNDSVGEATEMVRSDLPPKKNGYLRFIVISDTHTRHRSLGVLPEGDVFVHSGDILMSSRLWTSQARMRKYAEFNDWLGSDAVRCPRKIVIGGNHDAELEIIGYDGAVKLFSNATYLQNSSTIIHANNDDDGENCHDVYIYGTPCSNGRSGNMAFQSEECYANAKESAKASSEMFVSTSTPSDQAPPVVFISHGQNRSIREWLSHSCNLKAHLWGHAHGHHGVSSLEISKKHQKKHATITSICSSIMDTRYCPTNPPVVFDLFVGKC